MSKTRIEILQEAGLGTSEYELLAYELGRKTAIRTLKAAQIVAKEDIKSLQKMDKIFQANLQFALARNDSTCYNLTADLYEQFLSLFGGYIEEEKEKRAD